MNKELIKAYFEEFKHWLNGGKILAYYRKENEPRWWTDEECIEFIEHESVDNFSHMLRLSLSPEDVLIVIDDYYVEFRKALAEGKIVEYLGYKNEWKNLTENCRKLEGIPLEELRIKPEEPKFKVGDWAVNKTSKQRIVKKVTSVYRDSVTVGDSTVGINVMSIEDLELWKPNAKEYFWYKNDLVKFDEIKTNAGTLLESARGCSYYPAEENFKDYCEPFIGRLPTYIKG